MTDSKILSVVIPAFNESATIQKIVQKVLAADICQLTLELIIVDDCSTDNTWSLISKIADNNPKVKVIRHSSNQGKGSSLKTGFSLATGEILLIQDADLEYDPKAYPSLLNPIVRGDADVVYGSRFRTSSETRVLYFWHRLANGALTFFSNMFTNLNLTDMETGYKVFRSEVIKKINLKEKRFGIEPEITAKIARIPDIRIFETGISYFGRTYNEGKKIGLKDAFRAFYVIIKYGIGQHTR